MSYLDTIPKTLNRENPLLFSFLMILDAMQTNIRFNGKYERALDAVNLLPAFEYAVNTWAILPQTDGTELNGASDIELDVIAAIWTEKPIEQDNGICWAKFPNGTELEERSQSVGYTYDFEAWRIDTFKQLQSIILSLFIKGSRNEKTLADIFRWKLVNNRIDYVYAKNQTANQLFGVGARFTMQGNYFDCCPTPNKEKLTKAYFEGKGFVI